MKNKFYNPQFCNFQSIFNAFNLQLWKLRHSLKIENWKLKIVLPVLILSALLAFFFGLDPLEVGGNSMVPTFQNGDRLIVEKASKYVKAPKRGEVIVFREPHERKEVFIKRVIGLPGETVRVEREFVVIAHTDGNEEIFVSSDIVRQGRVGQLKENTVITEGEFGALIGGANNGELKEMKLGPEDYFVMGDNRRGSIDSRSWGTVQPPDIIGRPLVTLSASAEKRGTLLSFLSQEAQKGAPLGLFARITDLAKEAMFWLLSFGKDQKADAVGNGVVISNSLRFNDDDSAYLTRTPAGAGTSLKKGTISVWTKRSNLGILEYIFGVPNGPNEDILRFNADDTLEFRVNATYSLQTNAKFRDPAAWYHIVVRWDFANTTWDMYVNGTEVSYAVENTPANTDIAISSAVEHRIGRGPTGIQANYLDGYMSDFYFIDGQFLTLSSFGETDASTGIWEPKTYAGTYGTNGFHLDFANSADLGNDVSGNNNDFTANNLAATDQMSDTPTTNYVTLNPLDKYSGITLADGNLRASCSAIATYGLVRSTIQIPSTGKFYAEFTLNSSPATDELGVGVVASTQVINSANQPGRLSTSWIINDQGDKANGGAPTNLFGNFTAGQKAMVAVDRTNNKIWFGQQGTWSGDPGAGTGEAFSNLSGDLFFATIMGSTQDITINTGQSSFTYTVPSGFSALNTGNLPTPAVLDGSDHFQTTLYTGTGAVRDVVQTGFSNFQPDLVWIKNRDQADEHKLIDVVRGVTKELSSDSTNAEATDANGVTNLEVNGFSVGTGANGYNDSAEDFAAWQWKANGAGVSNTEGTVTATVSANTTAGFSIVRAATNSTSGTLGHGLGVVPKMIIEKRTDDATANWIVWHGAIHAASSNDGRLFMETTDANGTGTCAISAVTSTLITNGSNATCYGGTGIYYVFAEVDGFSKIGSYTGNGAADGPFVHTGFKPAYVLVKNSTTAATRWYAWDNRRSTYNVVTNVLFAEDTLAENTGSDLDFLSNGFKIRDTEGGMNTSTNTYVYAAFAENPFGGSGTIPTTAALTAAPVYNFAGAEVATSSLRFNDDDSAYLTRTPSVSGNRKTWTISLWFKRANVNARVMPFSAHTASNNRASIDIQSDGDSNTFSFIDITTTVNSNLITTQRLRDPAAWDHWVVGHDSTQATASDRIKIWHNGVRVTAFSTETYPSLDRQTLINLVDVPNDIGRIYSGSTFSDAYKADFYLIDGLQLDADSFGETDATTGSWKPKAVASTLDLGTNGFHLDFADSADLGADTSGRNNDFAPTNLAATDKMSDTPTNNYATLNSVQEVWGQAVTLSDGNLHVTGTGVTVWNNTSATFTMKSGKWIWAVKPDQAGAGRGDPFITNETGRNARANNYTGSANSWGPTVDTTTAFITYAAGSGTTHTLSPAFATGDLVLIAFDADAKKAWFGRYDASTGVTEWADGSTGWTGDPAAGTNETVTVTGNEFWAGFSALSGRTFDVDFGQNSLMSGVTIPTGFNFFNTTNLSAPTIPDPSAHFQTTLYTGNGSTQTITQGGHSTFQPDVVWIKTRNVANIPGLWDAVRGTGKELVPSEADAEGTRQGVTAFNSNGFSIGSNANYNTNTETEVAWQWKANGAGSSNTAGSITSTVSANTTAGFSIVRYTGTGANATVGHGLGVVPKLIIVKQRNSTFPWKVYHASLGATKFLELQNSDVVGTGTFWNDTIPTASVFSVNTQEDVNALASTYVAYAFAEVEGFSKFGSYTGNGAADGPFVYTGFKPAFILTKNTGSVIEWPIIDNARDTYNVAGKALYADGTFTEETSGKEVDLLSNGFKIRNSGTYQNTSGNTMIYIAFAEVPFKYATAGAAAAAGSGGSAFLLGMPF